MGKYVAKHVFAYNLRFLPYSSVFFSHKKRQNTPLFALVFWGDVRFCTQKRIILYLSYALLLYFCAQFLMWGNLMEFQ